MAINKLTGEEFGWHIDQADVPGKTAEEMKKFFDAPAQALLDKINEVIGEGEAVDLSTLRQELDKKANADALNTLKDTLELALDNKADADALNTLKDTLELALDNKADAEALSTLRQELDKKANADALNTLKDTLELALDNKADADALNTLKDTLELALDNKADAEALSTLREDLDKKANADALNTEITALKNRDDTLSAEITALSNQSIKITNMILQSLSELGTQQDSHSTAINELSAQQASTAPVFIDHFDLTVEETNNIYTECILKGRALVIKEGAGKYVCNQVYANGTGDQIAFIYIKCSSSGEVTFHRHGYVLESGMHYPMVYTLQTM